MLSIIIFILLVIILILFVPLHYKITVLHNDISHTNFLLESSWLLHIFSFYLEYKDGKPHSTLKIFNFNKKAKKIQNENTLPESSQDTKPTNEKLFDAHTIWSNFKKYPYKKELLDRTLILLKKILKALSPSSLKGKVNFGFLNPSQTGMLLGALHIVLGVFGWERYFIINGTFDRKILDLDFCIIGRLRISSLTFPIVPYIISKPVWYILSELLFDKDEND